MDLDPTYLSPFIQDALEKAVEREDAVGGIFSGLVEEIEQALEPVIDKVHTINDSIHNGTFPINFTEIEQIAEQKIEDVNATIHSYNYTEIIGNYTFGNLTHN